MLLNVIKIAPVTLQTNGRKHDGNVTFLFVSSINVMCSSDAIFASSSVAEA